MTNPNMQVTEPELLEPQKKRRKPVDPVNEHTQLNTLLNSIESIEFDLRKTKHGLLDIKLHLVASPKALAMMSGLIGAILIVIKLLGR